MEDKSKIIQQNFQANFNGSANTNNANINNQTKKSYFAKEMPLLLYSFGDTNPLPETCSYLESILIDFMTEKLTEAQATSLRLNHRSLKMESLKLALQKDNKKLARLEELLVMNESIQQAKSLYDRDEMMD